MALNYEVCQLRATGYSATSNNSGGQKSCQVGFTQEYLVKVTDPADPNFKGGDVSDIQAAFAPGIPIVNYHCWYDAVSGLSSPMAVCNSKSVKRMEANSAVFKVSCTFKTESGKQGPQQEAEIDETTEEPIEETPPETVDDIAPVVTRSVIAREIVLHEAPAYSYDGSAISEIGATGVSAPVQTKYLPCTFDDPDTGNPIEIKNEINQPITRKQPLLQLTVTQFEDDFSDNALLERCYKVNTFPFRGFQGDSAMITNISAVKQNIAMIELDEGGSAVEPRNIVQVDKYRVTYTILIDEYSVEYDGNSLFVGHSTAVPMIGKFFKNASNKIKQFAQKGSGLGAVGLVLIDGTKAPSQMGEVPYVRYSTVDAINFSSFLQDSVINP
jgi:hypothetical protein